MGTDELPLRDHRQRRKPRTTAYGAPLFREEEAAASDTRRKPEEQGVTDAEKGERIWERGVNQCQILPKVKYALDLAPWRVKVILTKTV